MAQPSDPQLSERIEKAKRELEEFGVAVVPNVLSEEECNECSDLFKEWISKFDNKMPNRHLSIIHDYKFGWHELVWKVRHKVRSVFAELWGTNKLLTSLDGGAVAEPPELNLGSTHFNTGKHSLHHDQGEFRIGLHAYQGAVYLETADEDDYCFMVMEKSHKHHEKFFQQVPPKSMEFRRLSPSEVRWFERIGCPVRKIAIPKGGIVLWDSRTVHAGSPPMMDRVNKDRWRFVVFVCMTPAIWANERDKELKREIFEEMAMTGHWASSRISKTGWNKEKNNAVLTMPENACTDEALQLLGIKDYDFVDNEPNGPPAPTFKT